MSRARFGTALTRLLTAAADGRCLPMKNATARRKLDANGVLILSIEKLKKKLNADLSENGWLSLEIAKSIVNDNENIGANGSLILGIVNMSGTSVENGLKIRKFESISASGSESSAESTAKATPSISAHVVEKATVNAME